MAHENKPCTEDPDTLRAMAKDWAQVISLSDEREDDAGVGALSPQGRAEVDARMQYGQRLVEAQSGPCSESFWTYVEEYRK